MYLLADVVGPEISVVLSTLTNESATCHLFGPPAIEYIISLTQIEQSNPVLCPSPLDNRAAVTTTANLMTFADLNVTSTYRVTVTAVYDALDNTTMTASSSEEFITLNTGEKLQLQNNYDGSYYKGQFTLL